MDIFKPIVRHVTAPLYDRRDGYSYGRHIRELERSQWLSSEEIAALQQERLADLLDFVYRSNGFHHARMKAAGLLPSDVRSSADLTALPLLTKDDIRAAGMELFSRGYSPDNTLHTRTGGSTGVPLHVYVDHEAMNWKYAATWRHNGWAGWRQGDRVASVWGDTEQAFQWKAWLRFHLHHRMIYLDTLKFSPDRLREFHRRLTKYRAEIVMGHAHSVYQFARFCLENALRVPPLRGVVTTAMSLLESERQLIEQAFDARVYNRYGCEELSIIASESEVHFGLHVFSEGLVLEYLPTDVEGEYKLVVTDLLNRAMPMIRYDIGDVVRKLEEPCPSGRGLERFARVSGRTADFLYRPDGTPVFGISILDTYIIHIPGIKQVQIVQVDFRRFVINVVPTAAYNAASEARLRSVMAEQFGPEVAVEVVRMDALPQTERGKYRFSICLVQEVLRST